MEVFQLTYAAFLFPAIPLMMLTFGNRWIAISKLIRQMHADLLNNKYSKKESKENYLTQIKILSLRLEYVKYMQLLSGLAFIFNLLTIFLGIYGDEIAIYFFSIALILFSLALCVFIVEINLSSRALKTHLKDIELRKF